MIERGVLLKDHDDVPDLSGCRSTVAVVTGRGQCRDHDAAGGKECRCGSCERFPGNADTRVIHDASPVMLVLSDAML
jgi:hypothetical protein